jgi:hypothetical protein
MPMTMKREREKILMFGWEMSSQRDGCERKDGNVMVVLRCGIYSLCFIVVDLMLQAEWLGCTLQCRSSWRLRLAAVGAGKVFWRWSHLPERKIINSRF